VVLWGEALGGKRDPQQGGVLLLVRWCCVGRGCSELQLTSRIVPIEDFKETVKTRIDSVLFKF